MTQHQINYDRERLIKELTEKFTTASGYATNQNDVNQWSVAMDALVKTIEGIVDAKLVKAFETNAKPPYRDDRE